MLCNENDNEKLISHMSKSHDWPGGVTGCWFKMLITHRISMAHCINIQKIIIIKFPSIIINFPVRPGSGALANQPPWAAGPGSVLMITSGISRWKHPQRRGSHRAGTNDHKGFPSHPEPSPVILSRPGLNIKMTSPIPGPGMSVQMCQLASSRIAYTFRLLDQIPTKQNLPDTSLSSIKVLATQKYLHTGPWVMVWCSVAASVGFIHVKQTHNYHVITSLSDMQPSAL